MTYFFEWDVKCQLSQSVSHCEVCVCCVFVCIHWLQHLICLWSVLFLFPFSGMILSGYWEAAMPPPTGVQWWLRSCNEGMFRSWKSVRCVSFIDTVDWHGENLVCKNLCHIYHQIFLFWNKWRNKIKQELAHQASSGKLPSQQVVMIVTATLGWVTGRASGLRNSVLQIPKVCLGRPAGLVLTNCIS